jgi:hypothetical protein
MKITNNGSSKQSIIVETIDGKKITVDIRPNTSIKDNLWARVFSRITSAIVVEGAIPVAVPKAVVAEVKPVPEVKIESKPVEIPKEKIEKEVKKPITKPVDAFDDYEKVESHPSKKHEFVKPSISSKKPKSKK